MLVVIVAICDRRRRDTCRTCRDLTDMTCLEPVSRVSRVCVCVCALPPMQLLYNNTAT